MTGRERIVAAARGGEVDRKPIILWGDWSDLADACVLPIDQTTNSDSVARLALVNSPLSRAMKNGEDLNASLANNPEVGNARLDALVEETRVEMQSALEAGADGIAYYLDGAYPAATTPMQFGGFYLERDRELLETVQDARFNLIFIEGTEEVYLDSVSDLPADALAWRVTESQFSIPMMRELRSGLLAGMHPDADLLLTTDSAALTPAPEEISV